LIFDFLFDTAPEDILGLWVEPLRSCKKITYKTSYKGFKDTYPNTSSPSSLLADFENLFLLAATIYTYAKLSGKEATHKGRTTSGFFRTPLRGVTDLAALSNQTLCIGVMRFTGLSSILTAKHQ